MPKQNNNQQAGQQAAAAAAAAAAANQNTATEFASETNVAEVRRQNQQSAQKSATQGQQPTQ